MQQLFDVNSEFEKLLEAHRERITARTKLKDEARVELMDAVKEWQKNYKTSRRIFSDVHEELNRVIQDLTSCQIKRLNGLAKSALIRDYYHTNPLIDYSSLCRIAANLIRCGIDPIEAIHLAAALYFPSERIPQVVPLIENIHKVTKLLLAKMRERELMNDSRSPTITEAKLGGDGAFIA